MITIVLAACPESLRGHLTRWLTEVAPGTFVGKVNSRIRDKLWELVVEECKSGRAIMTFTSRQLEQGYDFRVHNHNWEGLKVIHRPTKKRSRKPKAGWSRAGRKRRFGH